MCCEFLSLFLKSTVSSKYIFFTYEIVFQESQFEPTRNGTYEKVKPVKNVKREVSQALMGLDSSQGALFFRSYNGAKNSRHNRF